MEFSNLKKSNSRTPKRTWHNPKKNPYFAISNRHTTVVNLISYAYASLQHQIFIFKWDNSKTVTKKNKDGPVIHHIDCKQVKSLF